MAMEAESPPRSILDTVDNEINAMIRICGIQRDKPTESQCFDIVKIIDKHYGKDITKKDITVLMDKNKFAHDTIHYFFNIAYENLGSVTIDTFTIVTNPEKKQPIDLLNDLPFAIKKYVMETTCNRIYQNVYKIPRVKSISINGPAHLAATWDHDGNFKLINLLIAQHTYTFPSMRPKPHRGYVQFLNEHLLANIVLYREEEGQRTYYIDIWNTSTMEHLWTLIPGFILDTIDILHNDTPKNNTKKSILSLTEQNTGTTRLYQLKKGKKEPQCLGILRHGPGQSEYHIKHDESSTYIRKKALNLHLCDCIIQNSPNKESASKITDLPVYTTLSKFERKQIDRLLLDNHPNQ